MILKELSVVASTYTDNNGAEKKRWAKIGHLHQTQDGTRQYITLDPLINIAAIPRKPDDDRVYVNLFEPKGKDEAPATQGRASTQARAPTPAPAPDNADDDIPF